MKFSSACLLVLGAQSASAFVGNQARFANKSMRLSVVSDPTETAEKTEAAAPAAAAKIEMPAKVEEEAAPKEEAAAPKPAAAAAPAPQSFFMENKPVALEP